jgi:hypothetical protein
MLIIPSKLVFEERLTPPQYPTRPRRRLLRRALKKIPRGRIFATNTGVFLRVTDTISPAKNVLVASRTPGTIGQVCVAANFVVASGLMFRLDKVSV